MRLSDLRESVQEESVLRIFSRLVTVVNNVAELIGTLKEQDEAHERIGEQVPEVDGIRRRLERLNLTPDQWKNLRPSISNVEVGSSWMEFRATLTRRLLPELLQSMKALSESPIQNMDAKIAIANERVQNLQQVVVGLAPQGDIEQPQTDMTDQELPAEQSPDPEAGGDEPSDEEQV